MKYYIDCSYQEKEEAKKLGAKWDPKERKWYYTKESDKPKFLKWITEEIIKKLPDLSDKFDEKHEEGKDKFFLRLGRKNKVIIRECISEDGYVDCYELPIKRDWDCYDCPVLEEEFESLYSEEECDEMSDKEILQCKEQIISKCKKHKCDVYDYSASSSGDIYQYIDDLDLIGASGSKIVYLGQFTSAQECRDHLSKFKI